ncbi:MAG: phosphatase PAP2 family protein [Candidatus Paceibacterota bacterium]
MNFDLIIFQFINGLAGKFKIFDLFGIFLANYLGYFLIFLAVLLIITRKNWQQRFYFFSLTTLSIILARGIITEIIRFFYSRPRPFSILQIQPLIELGPGGSFPSGHMTFYFALAFAVFFIHKRWGWRLMGATFIIGLARIFTGIHWPLDIIAGAVIGIISVLLIKKLLPSPKVKPRLF